MSAPSVNREAVKIVKEMCEKPEKYNVIVKRDSSGAHIIDAGISAKGGFITGKAITEICLGGLGEAHISWMHAGRIILPSITVYTDHPAIAMLGSQLAGWRIKVSDYMAIGSGPARALALKPKKLYKKIGYKDRNDEAVLVLETSAEPPKEAIRIVAESCGVSMEKIYLILVPTASIAGLTQISGRIAETGMHKLFELGLDPNSIYHAWGQAPIPLMHPDSVEAMGRANDTILYGGVAHYIINHDDDEILGKIVQKAVSSASKDYGKPFAEIFREADQDFYKIDPQIFAPAMIVITNLKSGRTFTAGEINMNVLLRSMGIKP